MPEQLLGLGEHQRERAAVAPGLFADRHLGTVDPRVHVLVVSLRDWPLEGLALAIGKEVTQCAAHVAGAATWPWNRPVTGVPPWVRGDLRQSAVAVRGEPADIGTRLAQCRDETGNNVIRASSERPG